MIVLDSSFLIGFYNEKDLHHATASTLMREFETGKWGKGLLLEYVFLEVVTVVLVRRDLASATRVGRTLLDAQELEFVPSSDLFLATWERFASQLATKLSFVDEGLAHVALKRADGLILTFDEEFRKVPGLQVVGIEAS